LPFRASRCEGGCSECLLRGSSLVGRTRSQALRDEGQRLARVGKLLLGQGRIPGQHAVAEGVGGEGQ